MASAAEQLAANMNVGAFAKATDLHKRLGFTVLALIVYRLGSYIPIPGIDSNAFAALFNNHSAGILGWANMFSGGAVSRMAIFSLNVMPYISASIIVQLLQSIYPPWDKLKKEGGEAGRKQLNQYTRYLAVVLALGQSFAIAMGLQNQQGLVYAPGFGFILSTIVARLPAAVGSMLTMGNQGQIGGGTLAFIAALVVGVMVAIVFMERAQRRLLIQYPKRQVGNRMFGGESSFLPIKINASGVIPPIFASSLLLLPATALQFGAGNLQNLPSWAQWVPTLIGQLQHGQPLFMVLYGALIIFFCFFYTSVVFPPDDTAENLRKYGGFLPGIRPGKRTAEYLDYVLTRLTVIGAAYITVVCLLPEWFIAKTQSNNAYFGGTSLLIVVSVTMDTVAQIQSHLLAHQYEGLIKKSKLRGKGR